jgi:putative hydroxymethylpyrimidine transport system ATP-binding protein
MVEYAASSENPSFSIAIDAARVAFDGVALFEDLHLTLHAGHWTCLLGESGVGKSTLLRLVAGLLPPDSDVSVACDDGRPLTARCAYMAQQDLLLPWSSVLDNVTLGERLRLGRAGGATLERAHALLARVGLGDAANALPATLSGGMRQRAALVRTLMEDRPVVLMDEPFSALDAITRVRLQELAADLLRGRTVLLVTHDPLEALRLGDRIHVLLGRPARLAAPMEMSGPTPRPLHDATVLSSQADLLVRLAGSTAP